jgi:hypothetical protein
VASFLDDAASCVSTSWQAAFAVDRLWAQLCRSHYLSAIGLLPLHAASHGSAVLAILKFGRCHRLAWLDE